MKKQTVAFKALAAAGLAALCGAAFASGGERQLTGAELRKLLTGNTVWVLRQDMTQGDEYHLPDGRVFGFNGVEHIDNGCWDIVGDEVCYYYKDDTAKGRAHCWTFRFAGEPNRFHLRATGSLMIGYGVMDPGNPRNLNSRGKEWTCQKLLSQAPVSRRSVNVAAARE